MSEESYHTLDYLGHASRPVLSTLLASRSVADRVFQLSQQLGQLQQRTKATYSEKACQADFGHTAQHASKSALRNTPAGPAARSAASILH